MIIRARELIFMVIKSETSSLSPMDGEVFYVSNENRVIFKKQIFCIFASCKTLNKAISLYNNKLSYTTS